MGSVAPVSPPAAALTEIRELYLSDDRPWVIGYSGGKDSTATLQLMWEALAGLASDQLHKPVYVIAGDTLVETPVIIDYLADSLDAINAAARKQGLPFEAHRVSPDLDETFWVNVIGRGYPAPSSRFRWCTERMKINPANRFIVQRVAEHGEVVVVLGARRQESATRAQVMSLRSIEGSLLSRHSRLPNAYVYTPVRDWSVDDVWTYLLQVPCPWGNDNRDLLAMYRQSSSDECPLVVDTTTPSCGSSRFGCWTCTVVTRDKAMEAMIDKGQEWLEPLLEVRDFLADTQVPARKAKVRQHVRKNGTVTRKTKGDAEDPIVRGPYKLEFCREVLTKLLQAEQTSRDAAPPGQAVQLIGDDELRAIRRIWRFERGDWEDSLPGLVAQHCDREVLWLDEDATTFGAEDERRLTQLCEKHGLSADMVKRLIDAERELQGFSRRAEVQDRVHAILGAEWRSETDVIADIQAGERDDRVPAP